MEQYNNIFNQFIIELLKQTQEKKTKKTKEAK